MQTRDFCSESYNGELLYTGDFEATSEIAEVIKSKWPETETQMPYDFIHQYRLEVGPIQGITRGDFYAFAIEQGFLSVCFVFQCAVMMPECQASILAFLESMRADSQ